MFSRTIKTTVFVSKTVVFLVFGIFANIKNGLGKICFLLFSTTGKTELLKETINWYFVRIKEMGIQIFFPVSPLLCLVMFDSVPYGLHNFYDGRFIVKDPKTIQAINPLVAGYAIQELYFSRDTSGRTVEKSKTENSGCIDTINWKSPHR